MNDNNIIISSTSRTQQEDKIYAPFVPDEESPYIFISYAHNDRNRVFPIIKDIYEQGWRVWYDEGLLIGNETDYADQLAAHIRECAIIIVFVTYESVRREFVIKKELEFGINIAKKRVIFCQLDNGAEMPDGIKLLTANEKDFPRTNVRGLIKVLESQCELNKLPLRKAIGLTKTLNFNGVLPNIDDGGEYEWMVESGYIKLTKYKGSKKTVHIPSTYKGLPVGSLEGTFDNNNTVQTIYVSSSVKIIGERTFTSCKSLRDIYIPSSVLSIYHVMRNANREFDLASDNAFNATKCIVHCPNDSKLISVLEEIRDEENNADFSVGKWSYVVDSTNVVNTSDKYVYCSFEKDIEMKVQPIIQEIISCGCAVVSSQTLNDYEKIARFNGARCFIAFVSKGYNDSNEIQFLRLAISCSKKHIVYFMDNYKLPDDISLSNSCEQQLRYDSGTAEDRLSKLTDWLRINGCLSAFAIMSDYEYTSDGKSITITKYIGNNTEIIIPKEFCGCPVVAIGRYAFQDCRNVISITVPEGVTSIGWYVFERCSSLTSINIPKSVTNVGSYTFSKCKSLMSVNIPDSVTSIGEGMFENCNSLTSVIIPVLKVSELMRSQDAVA